MSRIAVCIVVVLIVIYVVPFLIYGLFTVVAGLKPPEGVSPLRLLASILVTKVGTALAFVLILYYARGSIGDRWLLYALIWWAMFVLGEVGQALGPNYTWKEAIAGVISEAIYFPLSAYITHRLAI